MRKHPYHLVDPSPWPLVVAISLLNGVLALISWLHYGISASLGLFYFVCLVVVVGLWWRDVVREATYMNVHTEKVSRGLRLGFVLFLVSEVMFFFGFFWAYFHSALSPTIEIGCMWPPYDFQVISLKLPTVNTLILLTSGASITYVHMALLGNKGMAPILYGMGVTIGLALIFTSVQLFEYFNAPFSFSDGIFGSVFYALTGLHGVHVIIGTLFLLIQGLRIAAGHFSSRNHLGFEAAAWYWHFVDVVWILLYLVVYVWPA